MGEERWQDDGSPWWQQEAAAAAAPHPHHMFSAYKGNQGVPGGSYSHQPASHWWYGPQIDNNHQVATAQHHPAMVAREPITNSPAPGTAVVSNQSHVFQNRGGTMPKSAKGEVKPRGRMTAYAYFVQICREEHKTLHPEENVVFAEFSKKCAERWKTMNDKDKKRFHDLADKDKKRYENEMKDYVPTEKKGKKRKQMKDPNAPKRPLSNVKQANPDYTAGDTSKELGRRWSEADPSVKSKYQELADKDKARYDKEITEYKKKGSFTSATSPVIKKKEEEDDDDDDEGDEDDE